MGLSCSAQPSEYPAVIPDQLLPQACDAGWILMPMLPFYWISSILQGTVALNG